ncbi:Acetoacetate decarboxylase (ADC) [Prauserella marina]|uniref:Acetoacetate decarboxylase (ADC) n=1 Tax=Prauserella marina TaxID=530584 RepID=A0A1G6V9X7_9PSEU|nr:acetoacetate decarboxylase family protein [Prauserella marina]PWV80262.1 acetoacetate decarboxylase [Prauserella marina]SDD50510.1 Acetoacetate decarboxylase (ADC) [Prauserella marina]
MTTSPTPVYPPSPWNLHAQGYLSAWALPSGELPELPAGITALTVKGTAFVFTAWIDYQPPGQLAYHELLAAVVVHNRHSGLSGRRPTVSITGIWVDSEVSLAGGRQLWAIPKGLASLDFTTGGHFTAVASTAEDWIATAAFAPRRGLPFAPPHRFAIAQGRNGLPLVTPVRSSGKPAPASASWHINPAGPLGFLAGRKPLFSAHLRDVALQFGD